MKQKIGRKDLAKGKILFAKKVGLAFLGFLFRSRDVNSMK